MDATIANSSLTSDQAVAFDLIRDFLNDDSEHIFVLSGSAGVGKSHMTKFVVDFVQDTLRKVVLGIAPTHKAKRVLSSFLNSGRFLTVTTMTVASFLGKIRNHSYIGTKNYSRGNANKLIHYDLIILDEISMVADEDYLKIADYVSVHDRKLICVGDSCQIPSPSQGLVMKQLDTTEERGLVKSDSIAFRNKNNYVLSEIVRQAAESPIIKLVTYLRDNLLTREQTEIILQELDLNHLIIKKEELYKDFAAHFTETRERIKNRKDQDASTITSSTKIIAYTNVRVFEHNMSVRRELGYKDKFVEGEIMVGVNNVGFPTLIIENGCEYLITNVKQTDTGKAGCYSPLVGFQAVLKSGRTTTPVFFVNPTHKSNLRFMQDIIARAKIVNAYGSKPEDYKRYTQLKNATIFTDCIFYYDNTVVTEATMREQHPLLFTKVSEVIDADTREIRANQLTINVEELYPGILEERLKDTKMYSDGEVLADRWCVIEKDLDYGYAITGHKCQGSTYENVYVDDDDFEKIKDRFNHKFGALEIRTKEFNQLKYVAFTRASKVLRIIL